MPPHRKGQTPCSKEITQRSPALTVSVSEVEVTREAVVLVGAAAALAAGGAALDGGGAEEGVHGTDTAPVWSEEGAGSTRGRVSTAGV